MNGLVSEGSSVGSEAPSIFCRDTYTLPAVADRRVGRSQEAPEGRILFCSPGSSPRYSSSTTKTGPRRDVQPMRRSRPDPSMAGTEITSHGQGGQALMAQTSDRATDLEKGRAQGPLQVWPQRRRSLYPRTPRTPSCTRSCCSSLGSRQPRAQGGHGEARQGDPEPRLEPPARACPLGGNPGSVGLAADSIQKSSL